MTEHLERILPELKRLRRELHQFPEVSENEFKTAERIKGYLTKFCSGTVRTIARTGVLVVFESGVNGKSVLLRADTDALPIAETNTFDHRSVSEGVSHKCGHDGHTVMMLGVAHLLSLNPPKTGRVVLLFQPAEENGWGAAAVLDDREFRTWHFDYVFALHNLPGFEESEIVIREQYFNANVKSMIADLHGKTAHAAEPEHGHNPALAIAEILQECERLTYNVPQSDEFFLITPIYITMGELAHGISAGEGSVHLTIRSWDLELFDRLCGELQDFIGQRCLEHQLSHTISWTQIFYANKNHSEANEIVRKAARSNGFILHEMTHPFKWGEDFGLFTQKFKGTMFGLGSGKNTPALHNPDYDFPDEITSTGIKQFLRIVEEVMGD
jgi:amidohydrolase